MPVVEWSDTGQRLNAPAGAPLLAALEAAGLSLPSQCRSGTCGRCRVRLLEGAVDYPFDPPALTPQDQAQGLILCCLARPLGDLRLARLDAAAPSALREFPVRVQAREWLAPEVLRLSLRLPRGEPFLYRPGQYIEVLGPDGSPRWFSVANAPDGEQLELHLRVTAQSRFARWAAEQMPLKQILRVRGPLGRFHLQEPLDRPLLLLAGGTGYAPIQALLQQLAQRPPAQPVTLFRGVRAAGDLYADAYPRQLAAAGWLRYVPVLSAPAADWEGARGWVHEALLAEYPQLAPYTVYAAGPPAMLAAARAPFEAAGLAPERFITDSFEDAPRSS
ncbi:MAG TPA: 2Fe-2S iron-sulfur cluster-binding protein [Nevskiaceae bacterium]|nr:2Fe-2S iron-sulfur cluster-binding protein [Nevskiaceae bacterium]